MKLLTEDSRLGDEIYVGRVYGTLAAHVDAAGAVGTDFGIVEGL